MKSVLVTGGSGFLGRGLVRALLDGGCGRVCVYSRGEYAQALMRAEFDDSRVRWFIGDVRDRDRLQDALRGVDAVIHAAALKRIEVGAYNPQEMVKTNVLGTSHVIAAALDAGVERAVLVSSDKAYQPVSPYGSSKALAESLFLAANGGATKFSVARYGNVAGSTGSVIPTWRLANGNAVMTSPECTRFWMTRDEAVKLVLDTLVGMNGGELVIPALPAFALGDLASAMGVSPRVIGLARHEKLHESLSHEQHSNAVRKMGVAELRAALASV